MDRLTIYFAGGAAIIVVATLTLGLSIIGARHYQTLLEGARGEALRRAELVRVALEQQMSEQHLPPMRAVTRRLVESFASQPELERVMVLDRTGRVKVSSDPSMIDVQLPRDSPSCISCHALRASERANSMIVDYGDGAVMRAVQPIYNRPPCYQCHDPASRINGIVIVDVSTAGILREVARDRRRMMLVTSVLCLVLLAGIGLLVRNLVLRRLHRLMVATRALGAGDLERRVKVEGNDALSTVAVEFNEMADAVSRLLREVRTQERRLANVMDSVDDGLVVLDDAMRVRAFNVAFARRFRIEHGTMLGNPCQAIPGLPSGCNCGDGCPARRCFATGELQRALRTRVGVEGEERIEEVYVSPVLGEGGAVEQVVEVWRDITDRKSTEARVVEFDRLASLGMLASGFSHEVNTPLGSMLACIDAMLEQLDEAASSEVARVELRGHAHVIRSEILRCKGITRQFLQLSRGEKIAPGLLDLNRVVEAVLPIVAPTARAAGVTLSFDSCPRARVLASDGAVQQVLLNLMINAVQVSSRGSSVAVSSRCGGEGVQLLVEDRGCGIPAKDRKRIFEPFFSTRPQGTGLGLFVSLGLARNWGGDIRVESEEGQGSTFYVNFPALEDCDGWSETASG